MSSKDKTLISDLMESFVSEVPANPFVSFCIFCNKGVIKEEMIYQKGYVFHKDCYNNHGSEYPQVNQESLNQNSNDKVQLVQLRNLKIRMGGDPSSRKPKSKKKSKRKTKKRSTKRKRTTTKRKNTKKKTSRRKPSKIKSTVKRRNSSKRKKATRKTKRRVSRKTKRKSRRRR